MIKTKADFARRMMVTGMIYGFVFGGIFLGNGEVIVGILSLILGFAMLVLFLLDFQGKLGNIKEILKK